MYSNSNPYLWPKSLENFTTAAGDNCTDPLTSANPCGITADFYNGHSMGKVVFKGYSGWETAGTTLLTYLLAGWSSGTAGNYLENTLGFQNMENKIFISSNTVTVSLNESGSNQIFVPFFDTQWAYNTLPNGGGPARTEVDFQEGVLTKHRDKGAICGNSVDHYYIDVDYDTRSGFSFDPNGFYNAYSHARYCETNGIYYTTFSFSTWPGFLAEQNGTQNKNKNAVQFRMPVASLTGFTCTENRLNKNIGGVWTMCGDDFTAYLDFNVPRPSTCDNPHSNTPCQLSASAVATAKGEFGIKYKTRSSL